VRARAREREREREREVDSHCYKEDGDAVKLGDVPHFVLSCGINSMFMQHLETRMHSVKKKCGHAESISSSGDKTHNCTQC
jgi:hypothetical protein